MARQSLGRGLSALIGEEETSKGDSGSLQIDIDLIDPNPEQPRTRFTEVDLGELAQSIKANGVVQPIVVRQRGGRYQIVAGERRWRAAQRAGLHRIPAVIKDVSDEKLLELALLENIQRQQLNPIEEARAYRKLIDNIGLTQELLSERVGKDRTVITTSLRLLRLPDEVQQLIEAGSLSAGHGRALLMADDPAVQLSFANTAIAKAWSVREAERAVKRWRDQPDVAGSETAAREIDANVKAAEVKLKRTLNTKVKIVPSKAGPGGVIEIEYYGTDDLDRIYRCIVERR
jgi:ParB family chromosome partitioning protein